MILLMAVWSLSIRGQSSQISELKISASGTGRTSGIICNVTFINPTDERINVDLGTCYIPSGGNYQPYIVPRMASLGIPPKGQITVPVNGYCADIHKPPVPEGAALPAYETWIFPEPLAVGWKPENSNGWIPSDGGIALVPGKDVALGHILDINAHPKEAAPVLMEAINLITETYGRLQNEGKVSTPFSGNPEKERESVIQQTFWIYTSELTGQGYKVEDFASNTMEQYETTTGKKAADLPETEKDAMVTGIADFWGTFQAVGAEAKVLATDERPADDVQFGIWTDIKDWLFAPDYSKVKKADDFDKIRRTKYDKYVVEREINKKSHEDACDAIDIDSESDFADACKRVYGK